MNYEFSIQPGFKIRNAKITDLDDLVTVEQVWPPDQRATVDQFLNRLERFAEGFWVAEAGNTIVGLSTSCLLRYDPEDLMNFCSWQEATNNGHLYHRQEIAAPNALYVVSTVAVKEYRGRGLFEAFFEKHKELTARLALDYSLTGAMLPGYNAHCAKHGEISAYEYTLLRNNGRPVDSLVRKLVALGYELPDQQHVIADYFQSEESRNYAALLVYRNPRIGRK